MEKKIEKNFFFIKIFQNLNNSKIRTGKAPSSDPAFQTRINLHMYVVVCLYYCTFLYIFAGLVVTCERNLVK